MRVPRLDCPRPRGVIISGHGTDAAMTGQSRDHAGYPTGAALANRTDAKKMVSSEPIDAVLDPTRCPLPMPMNERDSRGSHMAMLRRKRRGTSLTTTPRPHRGALQAEPTKKLQRWAPENAKLIFSRFGLKN